MERTYTTSKGIVKYIPIRRKPRNYWTSKRCKEETFKFKTKKQWRINSPCSYSAAIKKGYLKECSINFLKLREKEVFKKCHKEALKYNSSGEFKKKSNSFYNKAQRRGYLLDICSHMLKKPRTNIKPIGYWEIKENCIKAANKCETKGVFRKKYSTA